MTALSLSTSLRRIAQELASWPLPPAGRALFGRPVPRAGKRHLAAAIAGVAVLAALLLIPIPALAAYTADGQWYPSPDQPLHYYWFRTEQGVPAHPEVMDPRVEEIAEAFGRGDYAVTRQLAQTLLDSSDDPGLRGEAAAFIVESHIAEGDFAAARAAAERHEDWDAVERIESLKADYNRAVARLQQIVAKTDDPSEAARAQLLTAHFHQQFRLLDVAQASYWKVCWRHPKHPEAGRAIWEIARMHYLYGEPDDARTACKMAVDLARDGDLAVRACETIFQLSITHAKAPYQGARESLRDIAEAHSRTRAADTARLRIGELYAAEGLPEEAEEEWAALVADRPECPVAGEARIRLAEVRYEMGTRAFFEGDYARAIRCFEELLPNLDLVGVKTASGRWLDDAHPFAASKRRQAVFSLGEAYQKLGQWQDAADVFGRLAVAGSPAEEFALFQLGRSKMEAGYYADALEAFITLKDKFPESGFAPQCEDHIRTIQGEH